MKLVGMKLMQLDEDLAKRHYAAHVGNGFFPKLIVFITSGPLVAMVVEGENAVEIVRSIMGATDPLDAALGTVRGDFAVSIGPNLIHGSDSLESADYEIGLFFSEDEIVSYTREIDRWITES